jgi:pimeloyl-ACP methyl ester carboxylesterase
VENRHHYLRAHDGCLLHVVESGTSEVSCLLIHGLGDNINVWSRALPAFACYFRTLAVDLRGHGDSGWDPRNRYHRETYVSDVIFVIRTIKLDRIILVGHSLGSDIASRIASRLRSLIVALVIVDFGPELNPVATGVLRSHLRSASQVYNSVEQYEAWLGPQRPLVATDLLGYLARTSLRQTPDGTFRLKSDPEVVEEFENNTDNTKQLWALLSAIRCPVLVMRGAASAVLTRQSAERMIGVLAHGRLHVVPAAGHAVMADNPEGFLDGILPYLRRFAE